MVRIDAPEEGAVIAQDAVEQVISTTEPPLVLLVRGVGIVALGAEGIEWRSPRLAADDLRVGLVDSEGIHCTGDVRAADPMPIVVDPVSGQVSAGPRLESAPSDHPATRSRGRWWNGRN